jgi:DNA processing protein
MASLLRVCGSPEAAWHASVQQLREAGLHARTIENLLTARRTTDLDLEWQRVRQAEVVVLTWDDAAYPTLLREIEGSPPVLYVKGNLCEEDEWAVALVGTRRASAYGREVARMVATDLARQGLTVVSGLALGIDTVAHAASLDAGGRSVAVLGSGVDQLYPARNRTLALRVAEHGAVVSDYPMGTRPEAGHFPPRNRIISGLSRATVVIEAGERSGALITARFAAEQGREVFAVPGSIFHPGSKGCNALIGAGALPLLSTDDLMAQIGSGDLSIRRAVRTRFPPEPDEDALLGHLGPEPSHIDEICRRAEVTTEHANSLLAIMELKGLVRQVEPLCYVRI